MSRISDHVLALFVENCQHHIVKPLGEGLINQTFLVAGNSDKFVLQRINHHVFTRPENVVTNSVLISRHLNALGDAYPLDIMVPRANLSGDFMTCIDGEYWRALGYITNSVSVQTIDNAKQAWSAAHTFSRFSMALSTINIENIAPIIDKFHDVNFRFHQLSLSIENATPERKRTAQTLINRFTSQANFRQEVNQVIEKLPQRVTHNDTKINNLLFDSSTGEPKSVIDLDTCMVGYLMHDFGDMVRTCCSSLDEDDLRIDEMTLKTTVFDNLLAGYLDGLNDDICQRERQSLLVGAQLMPLMIGCRFLTDFLNNDVYFSTTRKNQNLARAANQFKLFELVSSYIERLKNEQSVVV